MLNDTTNSSLDPNIFDLIYNALEKYSDLIMKCIIKSGFVTRLTDFNPILFILAIIETQKTYKDADMTITAVGETYFKLKGQNDVSKSEAKNFIYSRFAHKHCVTFFHDFLEELLFKQFLNSSFISFVKEIDGVIEYLKKHKISGIYAGDGSIVAVTAYLNKKGKAKSQSRKKKDGESGKGGFKLHLVINLLDNSITELNITEGYESEITNLKYDNLPHFSIIILDRGYESHDLKKSLEKSALFYIIRTRAGKGLRIKEARNEKGELIPHLEGKVLSEIENEDICAANDNKVNCSLDLMVEKISCGNDYIGDERVIVTTFTDSHNGITYTNKISTNLKRDVVPAYGIAILYRFRWQIELVFKGLKSNFSLKAPPSRNIDIIKTFIYAALIEYFLLNQCAGLAVESIREENPDFSLSTLSLTKIKDEFVNLCKSILTQGRNRAKELQEKFREFKKRIMLSCEFGNKSAKGKNKEHGINFLAKQFLEVCENY